MARGVDVAGQRRPARGPRGPHRARARLPPVQRGGVPARVRAAARARPVPPPRRRPAAHHEVHGHRQGKCNVIYYRASASQMLSMLHVNEVHGRRQGACSVFYYRR